MALLTLPGGADLHYTDTGAASGERTVVFHHGTPGAALVPGRLLEAAVAAGWRVVAASRPGYGGSGRQPGRSVADGAALTAALADHLGVDRFATVGWSGGGPHALACAALLDGRCQAAAILAGVAPADAAGLDWLAGMGEENLEEWAMAREGEAALRAGLSLGLDDLRGADVAALIEGMDSLLSPVDRDALSDAVGEEIAASFALALRDGVDGWCDDDLAFLAPWGFAPAHATATGARVGLWQGEADLMVPPAHGRWLAGAVPGADLHWHAGDGHISLFRHADEIVAWLGAA